MRGIVFLAGLMAAASVGRADVVVSDAEGTLELNGSTYNNEDLTDSDTLTLISDGGLTRATLAPKVQPELGGQRLMMRFSASGSASGTYALPSDSMGGTSAASPGDSVILGTWNPDEFPNSHSFSAEVEASSGDPGYVDVEFRSAPTVTFVRAADSGDFLHPAIDNDSYDQDPATGVVVLDKTITPQIVLSVTTPDYIFSRGEVEWSDGSKSSSLNIDDVHGGAWALFSPAAGGTEPIFSADGPSQRFEIGQVGDIRVNGQALEIAIPLVDVPNGDHTLKLWSIPWHSPGYGAEIGFGSGGSVEDSYELAVTVVPEPSAGLAAVTLGLALRRRRTATRP